MWTEGKGGDNTFSGRKSVHRSGFNEAPGSHGVRFSVSGVGRMLDATNFTFYV